MPCNCKKHYDAWGNLILPPDVMRGYYRDDPKSLEIVKNCLPHQYVVIPRVHIYIVPGITPRVTVYLMYPGGDKQKELEVNPRLLDALRRTYSTKKGWIHRQNKFGHVVIERAGRVIRDPLNKFGCR